MTDTWTTRTKPAHPGNRAARAVPENTPAAPVAPEPPHTVELWARLRRNALLLWGEGYNGAFASETPPAWWLEGK